MYMYIYYMSVHVSAMPTHVFNLALGFIVVYALTLHIVGFPTTI